MTIAPNRPALAVAPAVDDVTTLLPSRERRPRPPGRAAAGHRRDAGQLWSSGLLRRDDGWPTPQSTLEQVTTLLAALAPR